MHWTDWLSRHLLSCPSVKFLHMQCPGCGLQRSFICLLRGEWMNSLKLHPGTVPLMVLLFLVPLHLRFKFRHGAAAIVALQALVAILSIGGYVYKIIHHQLIV